MSLDPEDPRPPYQQVASALRAAILTRTFEPGDRLPSQSELARQYGVARMTIQQALRILRDEGLTFSRQGSGVFVRERTARPVGLRPHVERAFAADYVTLDFSGYTAETLHGMLAEPLDQIRAGRLTPSSVRLRLLLSDMARPLALPVNEARDPATSGPVRDRMAQISARHAGAITAAVEELADLGLVQDATVETRVHGCAPLSKAYIINGIDVFFGYYPVVKHDVKIDGKRKSIYDPMGKDAELFQFTDDGDPDSLNAHFVTQTQAWFDSIWTTIADPAEQ